ncbi:MAG: MBL fold metallo-hydrolase [Nevskiaceae bacterium]|nr:MAG: MBL fold metallo-hydrolase [Nevskiaceae bacterium]TBR75121.1 MAG: MBL fold metallo-hydrolase [Nevskiaceae bacterium]
MRIHHLDCASLCPPARRFVQGEGGWLEPAHIVCHCLLIEGREGLVLVDTGFGDDLMSGRRPLPADARLLGLRPAPGRSALGQIRALGLDPHDVRDIVLTHLDFDHAGGLPDFPWARVHVYGAELDAATARRSLRERCRYHPAPWRDTRWQPHPEAGERWYGFDAVRALPGHDAEVLIVPLPGHTRGHAGVAVRHGERWLLHCGDAYFFHTEMAATPSCPPGLVLTQRLLAMDDRQRRDNQRRLHALKHAHGEIDVFCAHCPHEFNALQVSA